MDKTGPLKASSLTSSAGMNRQGATATRTEEVGVLRDVSVDGHVVLSDVGFGNIPPRYRAQHPSEGYVITDTAQYLLEAAQGGGEKSFNKFLKLTKEEQFDST